MRRRENEYREFLVKLVERINEKTLKTGLGASIAELKEEFGGDSKSQRNLDNHLLKLREKGIDGQKFEILYDRTHRVYRINQDGLTTQPNFPLEEKRKEALARDLLKPYKHVLPRSITKILDIDEKKTRKEETAPLFRSVSPRFEKSLEFYQLLNRILQLAESNKVVFFEYQVESENDQTTDLSKSQTLLLGWSEKVLAMPILILEYLGRHYVLVYRFTLLEIQASILSDLNPKNLQLYLLDNIKEKGIWPVDEHPDFVSYRYGVMNLQNQIQRRQIFEKLHLKEILHSSVGVMLPSPDTWFKNEVDQIEIKPPTKILRFFAGWAKRYLMTSPLHPSQTLVQTKIILPSQLSQDLQSFYQYKTQQNGVEVGVEVGLFSFDVYDTPDFLFRVASFREFTWEYQRGFEGKLINQTEEKFKKNSRFLPESSYKELLQKISPKAAEQADYSYYLQCETEWWDYFDAIYSKFSNPKLVPRIVITESAPMMGTSPPYNRYIFDAQNLHQLINPTKDTYLYPLCRGFMYEMHREEIQEMSKRDILIELAKQNVVILNLLPTHGIQLESKDRTKIVNTLLDDLDFRKITNFDYDPTHLLFAVPPSLYNKNLAQKWGKRFIDFGNIYINMSLSIKALRDCIDNRF